MRYKRVNRAYGIPLRSLIPERLDNVLVAGRCISISHEALASTRITATCMAMGQAAGTAAALCVRENVSPAALDVNVLRSILISQGMLLD